MSDDTLIARMRTCAAYLDAKHPLLLTDLQGACRDAISLLVEGADHIEREQLDRMKQLQKQLETYRKAAQEAPAAQGQVDIPGSYWIGTDLPPVTAKPCPSCGAITSRRIGRQNGRFMLRCPTCDHRWPLAEHKL